MIQAGTTPLMDSASLLFVDEIPEALLQAGADVNLQDKVSVIFCVTAIARCCYYLFFI